MIRPRTLRAAFAGAVLLTGVLAACAANEGPVVADVAAGESAMSRAAADVGTTGASGPGQCYWLSDSGEGWLEQTNLPDPEYCHELDSCTGGMGMSGGGCYKWAVGPEAPGMAWSDFGLLVMAPPAPEAPGAACYQLRSDMGPSNWVWWGGSEAKCYGLDACSGGLSTGVEGGMCYKWAMGPGEPGLGWSAALTDPALAEDVPPPEEIYEGSFEMTSDSCFENCPPVPVLLGAATPIYARPDASAPVVATFKADECVGNTNYKLLSAPRRGVVLEAHDTLVPGDVIYELAYDGEGMFSAWRRGEYLSLFYEDLAVRWDDPPEVVDPRVGYWLELERADGTSGWARDADVTFVEPRDGACPALRP